MLHGCTMEQNVRLFCQAEAKEVLVCGNCAEVWRLNAHNESLQHRCPRCALWRPGTNHTTDSPAGSVVLAGPVSMAVDGAMAAEGMTVGVRQAVLSRLARDDYWLTFVDEPMSGIAPGRATGNVFRVDVT
jgi:hypothetical protein